METGLLTIKMNHPPIMILIVINDVPEVDQSICQLITYDAVHTRTDYKHISTHFQTGPINSSCSANPCRWYKMNDHYLVIYVNLFFVGKTKSLVRSKLEYDYLIWGPFFKKDTKMVEQLLRSTTEMVPSMRYLEHGRWSWRFNLPSLQQLSTYSKN